MSVSFISNIISASEKREAMEKKLRAKLEEEVRELRAEQKEGFKGNLLPTGAENLDELRRKMRESEEKVGMID